MKKIVYFDPIGHQGHAQAGHPERPERLEVIKRALQGTGHWDLGRKISPLPIELSQLEDTHSLEYLRSLKQLSSAGQDFDIETYLTKKSWGLALQAVGGGIAVAKSVWKREASTGFALTRPPGHHATIDRAMGFCLINNVAAAANALIREEGAKRIAIVDLDVHHGNGTQDIFWKRNDVLFCSIHQSPLYPGTGEITESGEGAGDGFTLNIPLPAYSGDEAYDTAIDEILLPKLAEFEPEMLLISFGYDAHWRDPLANMLLSSDGYHRQIRKLCEFASAQCEGRIAINLEGGYDLDAGASAGLAVVQALLKENFVDELGPAPNPEVGNWERAIAEIKDYWKS